MVSQVFHFFEHFLGILKLPSQLIRFIIVGLLAALIHYLVALYVAHRYPALPFISNTLGFTVAFVWSYIGQRLITFRGSNTSFFKSLKRWLVISLSGFMLNQSLLWYFLKQMNYGYPFAVALAIGIVACLTFVSGKFWAFRSSD